MKQPTAKLAALIAKIHVLQGLHRMNEHKLLLVGGVPIKIGDVVGGLALEAHLADIWM